MAEVSEEIPIIMHTSQKNSEEISKRIWADISERISEESSE